MKHKNHGSIKSRSNSKLYAFFILIAVVLILIGGGAALLASSVGIDQVNRNAEVSVAVTVSGDDLIVKVLNDGRINDLEIIQISISGLDLVNNVAYKNVPKGGGDIVYSKVSYGVTGERSVLIRGYFSDDTNNILLVKTVDFGG
ncbi:MAG: hypothetical protein Q4Q53_07650 [Methanocorpusculum sp.]|nr:hypothetical protein [Methanocorpusculum sp.]